MTGARHVHNPAPLYLSVGCSCTTLKGLYVYRCKIPRKSTLKGLYVWTVPEHTSGFPDVPYLYAINIQPLRGFYKQSTLECIGPEIRFAIYDYMICDFESLRACLKLYSLLI